MSIKGTWRVYRGDAIRLLKEMNIEVFNSDSNERIEHELEEAWNSPFENYEVVDFKREEEPEDDKWPLWK